MSTGNRPLSPHLQIYKPQITSGVSILHRMTGFFLSIGTLHLAYWLGALAYGPDAFAAAQEFFTSWLGYLILFGWSGCFFYHLCNGIRHLFWDVGMGFEIEQTEKSGVWVFIGTAVLTVLAWWIALV